MGLRAMGGGLMGAGGRTVGKVPFLGLTGLRGERFLAKRQTGNERKRSAKRELRALYNFPERGKSRVKVFEVSPLRAGRGSAILSAVFR